MPYSIYNTDILLESVQKQTLAPSFLRDRYFPQTNLSEFATGDVLVKYKNGSQKCAPFVHPRKGGVTLTREGYQVERYTPPNVAPQRPLTIDDLQEQGFDEALFANATPEEREANLIVEDIKELDESITRTEEKMAAETMLTSGCIMKHITDDPEKPEEKEIRFYSEASNPNQFTPAKKWNASDATILEDLFALCQERSTNGLSSEDLLISPTVAQAILNNKTLLELLDTKNYNVGTIETQELPDGAKILGVLNVYGYSIKLISYNAVYTNDDGDTVRYLTDGKAVLTAPAAGHRVYGSVTQIEEDKQRHTYVGKRVPKVLTDEKTDSREIKLTSKPLLIPHQKAAFTCINAI